MKKAIGECKPWNGYRNHKGYGQTSVRVSTKRGRKTVYVHRLAWERANGPLPTGMCVCHKCDNPACYELSHLFLGSRADNNRDMCHKGRNNVGAAHAASRKVTDDQVEEMRAKWMTGAANQAQLATEYGVHAAHVSRIVRRVVRRAS